MTYSVTAKFMNLDHEFRSLESKYDYKLFYHQGIAVFRVSPLTKLIKYKTHQPVAHAAPYFTGFCTGQGLVGRFNLSGLLAQIFLTIVILLLGK
ncbi:hypothetical protein H6F42_12605 [Pseudanabaena sp. FACHB-1998]|nr:hypothetical protein [Pseudanabaena sp. FACHB-1998]